MAGPFSLIRTPKILFGPAVIKRLAVLMKNRGGQILIITGSKSFIQNKGIGDLLASLEKEKIVLHFDRIEKEPSPEMIDRITSRFRKTELQAVVAVGGGSVLDGGKSVSAMLPLESPVKDYLEGVGTKSHPGIKKFFIAVPTTSGTGSEVTANAVLSGSDPAGGFKRSLRHENLVPDLAIVDPELTLSCPKNITASSGMDAFTQLIESYLSLKSGPLTDALALDGIRHVHGNLEDACRNGGDLEARTGMAYAALLSGITLANAGLGLVHGFASSIGGTCDIPHGVICAGMMAIVNRYNINNLLRNNARNNTFEKYICLGKLFSDTDKKGDQWYMQFVADYLDEITNKLNISMLGTYGLKSEILGKIASETDHKSNPVLFDKEQLVEMLKARL